MPFPEQKRSIGIIGGGVIGLCSAYYLQKEGYKVIVLDKSDFNGGCSYLNAGMIVPSHIIPLAAPGVVAKGLHWMFSGDSPFSIHPGMNKDMLRWVWLFNRSATSKKVIKAIPHLRDISWLSKSLYEELASEKGFDFGFNKSGLFMLYQSASSEKEELKTAQIANSAGVQAEILSAKEIQRLEPELKVSAKGGIYFTGDAYIHPEKFMQDMLHYLKANGVKLMPAIKITGFTKKGEKIDSILTNKGSFHFDELVLACGAFTGKLLKKLKFNLPLQGGKGYSFIFENRNKNIHIPAILVDGKVAVTPMGKHLKVSGIMEIGGNPNKINTKRIRGMLKTLYNFYPELKNTTGYPEAVVSGLRPCSPDGLPYIGKLQHLSNLTIATGHGMMGMSLGPATGKLVSEIISGKKTSMEINPFDPARF